MITTDTVRIALHEVWGQQACHFARDWPDAFKRLMRPNDADRTSLKPRYEAAIIALAEAYRDGPPADGPDVIWRCFPMLDAAHCTELHNRLSAQTEAPDSTTTSPAMVPALTEETP
jgi:hypothetical protein